MELLLETGGISPPNHTAGTDCGKQKGQKAPNAQGSSALTTLPYLEQLDSSAASPFSNSTQLEEEEGQGTLLSLLGCGRGSEGMAGAAGEVDEGGWMGEIRCGGRSDGEQKVQGSLGMVGRITLWAAAGEGRAQSRDRSPGFFRPDHREEPNSHSLRSGSSPCVHNSGTHWPYQPQSTLKVSSQIALLPSCTCSPPPAQ